MLELSHVLRSRLRRDDESGAVLVTVVVVMFVGFVIASAIAASVIFTIQANATNKSSTQAFIAAESGRDVVVSQIVNGCTNVTALHADDTAPVFTADAKVTDGAKPTSFDDAGLTSTCPTLDTKWVVIRSQGEGPDGSATTVDAVYPWDVQYSSVPGGVVTYFSGSVTQGVAHYTGDLVLRDGNWSCNINGLLDGDLYVLSGTVSLSNGCTINGDVWADESVTSTSTGWKITDPAAPAANAESTGSITTNGLVHFTANGNGGDPADDVAVGGSIVAEGDITLDGNDHGTVGGDVVSNHAVTISEDSASVPIWTVTGATRENDTTDPVFVPTLEWLREATQWIDLNATADWGTREPGVCSMTDGELVDLMTTSGGPLVIDLTPCPNNATPFTGQKLSVPLDQVTIARDVVLLNPSNKWLDVDLSGTVDTGTIATAGDNVRQLFIVHVDPVTDRLPTCGSGGTQDQFDVSGVVDPDLRIMIYAPCGLGGTVNASFSGQLYADDTTHFIQSSVYTCKPMTWPVTLPKLGCSIKGADGVLDDTTLVQSLGDLVYQTER